MNELPEAFIKRMGFQLGDELQDFLRAMKQPPVRGIRMNPFKPFDGMEIFMAGKPVPWTENGFYLSSESMAGSSVFHEAGAYYLQDPAAMLPAEVMDVKPGERILDLCAAPGGKATQMALKMQGKGLIVSNEPVLKRALILSRNMERMGITNGIVSVCFPEVIPHTWDGFFDGVLVDAPCSGEGMFRKEPETRSEWTPEQAAGCAMRQQKILLEAARFVKPGGRLVYSTCTYNPEENEITVGRFLKSHPEFDLERFILPGAEGNGGMFLCLPHRINGEGQFVAKLRKTGNEQHTKKECSSTNVPSHTALRMFREQFEKLPEPNAVFGNTLVRIDEYPDIRKIKVLRVGLHLAEIKGNHLVPDHAAALGNIRYEGSVTELDAERVSAYISGMEIPGSISGWSMLQYKGVRIGWGKGSGGTIKNHYPKGIRKKGILTDTDYEVKLRTE